MLLGLAALPVLDLLHPAAGGQRGQVAVRARRLGALPAVAAALAATVFAGVGLAVDRFDADHPVPTHLMYALDADTNEGPVDHPRGGTAAVDQGTRRFALHRVPGRSVSRSG